MLSVSVLCVKCCERCGLSAQSGEDEQGEQAVSITGRDEACTNTALEGGGGSEERKTRDKAKIEDEEGLKGPKGFGFQMYFQFKSLSMKKIRQKFLSPIKQCLVHLLSAPQKRDRLDSFPSKIVIHETSESACPHHVKLCYFPTHTPFRHGPEKNYEETH